MARFQRQQAFSSFKRNCLFEMATRLEDIFWRYALELLEHGVNVEVAGGELG